MKPTLPQLAIAACVVLLAGCALYRESTATVKKWGGVADSWTSTATNITKQVELYGTVAITNRKEWHGKLIEVWDKLSGPLVIGLGGALLYFGRKGKSFCNVWKRNKLKGR